jgi:hypothetical protein
VIALAEELAADGRAVPVTLTDRFPDPGGMPLAKASEAPEFRYDPEPVDATTVAGDRKGLRTLFNAFHHLRPELAGGVLASAVADRRPTAVVEILQRKPIAVLGMLGSPLMALLVVPFMRPFRIAWIPLTYLIPAIPLFIMWDGIVSCFRIYDEQQLLSMAREADPGGSFHWQVQEIPFPPQPIPGIALVGIPR